MRFLVVGVILLALGIGASEYLRRNPSPDNDTSTASKTEATAAGNLLETAAVDQGPGRAGDAALFGQGLVSSSGSGQTVFASGVSVRAVAQHRAGPLLLLERNRQFALATIDDSAAVQVLSVRKESVGALAADNDTVYWAEGGVVLTIRLGSNEAKPLVRFSKATVSAISAQAGTLVVALRPTNADPFATEANGALVSIDASLKVKLVAGEQSRAHDVVIDQGEVFWVAGYPAALNRSPLDGSFTARIAERADSPIAVSGDTVIFRYPEGSVPELRRVAKAGGNAETLDAVDVEAVSVHAAKTAYASAGSNARVSVLEGSAAPKSVAAVDGAVKGLVQTATALYIVYVDQDAVAHVLRK